MVELVINVTNKELDSLEDLVVAWNLCDRHKSIINASEDELWKFTQTCKKCVKINKELRNITLNLWSKLVTSYEKSRKNK
ncbi:MAG: hypothetical protein ABIH20_01410 [Candidatus Diapherotrites archaeon]